MSEDILKARIGHLSSSRIHRVDETIDVLRVLVHLVNFRQRRPSFLAEVGVAVRMPDEPRGTFGDHEKENHDHDSENNLEGEGSAPRNGSVEEKKPEALYARPYSQQLPEYTERPVVRTR